MILEKIEIESFGKFKDFTLCFESGINVLYGVNEATSEKARQLLKEKLDLDEEIIDTGR